MEKNKIIEEIKHMSEDFMIHELCISLGSSLDY